MKKRKPVRTCIRTCRGTLFDLADTAVVLLEEHYDKEFSEELLEHFPADVFRKGKVDILGLPFILRQWMIVRDGILFLKYVVHPTTKSRKTVRHTIKFSDEYQKKLDLLLEESE